MGRWGKGIYESDSALDYFSTITDYVEREIAYWLSPEQITKTSHWVANLIAPLEIILLLEQDEVRSTVFMNQENLVERWRETFLGVWDSPWEPDQYSRSELDDYAYRQQTRPMIVSIFDRLESINHFWVTIQTNDHRPEFTPLIVGYTAPYFSKHPGRLVEKLVKDIIAYLSLEMRHEALGIFTVHEELPVAIDILGLVCNAYKRHPIVFLRTVRKWRETTLEIINQTRGDYEIADQSEHYANIMAAFDRLEEVTKKYPNEEWLDYE
jgi:hypothetical protein